MESSLIFGVKIYIFLKNKRDVILRFVYYMAAFIFCGIMLLFSQVYLRIMPKYLPILLIASALSV